MKFIRNCFPLVLFVCNSAFAEKGMDYNKILSCYSSNSEIRLDSYTGYGHGGPDGRRKIQLVITGEAKQKIIDAKIFSTKISSNENEVIFDDMELTSVIDSKIITAETYLSSQHQLPIYFELDINNGSIFISNSLNSLKIENHSCIE